MSTLNQDDLKELNQRLKSMFPGSVIDMNHLTNGALINAYHLKHSPGVPITVDEICRAIRHHAKDMVWEKFVDPEKQRMADFLVPKQTGRVDHAQSVEKPGLTAAQKHQQAQDVAAWQGNIRGLAAGYLSYRTGRIDWGRTNARREEMLQMLKTCPHDPKALEGLYWRVKKQIADFRD